MVTPDTAQYLRHVDHYSHFDGARLDRASLVGASLVDARLVGARLTPIRDDLWAVLSSCPAEATGLLSALRDGRVDGSTYSGECACLVGTLANCRNVEYDAIPGLTPNLSRPAEVFFIAIRPGDTPEKSQFAKLAAEWTEEWIGRMQAAFGKGQANDHSP
jgi:hypothetical protein